MRKRKSGQPAGTDLDWFVIPIQKIRQWAIVLVLLLVAGGVGYFVYSRSRRLAAGAGAGRDRAGRDAAGPRDRGPSGATRPGSNVAQARDFLRDARESFSGARYDEAFRLAVESQSYSRRTLGGSGAGEQGDASFIFVEGDVVSPAGGALDLRAGAPARAALRRRLRQGRARRARRRSCSTTGRSTRSARDRSSSAAARSPRKSAAARSR